MSGPSFWHWWILAGLCLLAEALTPGFVFLWLGISGGVTGLLLLTAPGIGWRWQVLAFTALSLASVAAWLAWGRRRRPTDDAGLNSRAAAYIGRSAVLEAPIGPGRHGRLRLGDTTWAATGPDLPAGTRVSIVAVRGTVFEIVPAGAGTGGIGGGTSPGA